MPKYVDGFLIPVKKDKLEEYKKMAKLGKKVWMKYGALDYKECVQDDLMVGGAASLFPRAAKAKADEVVVFAFIVYKSRAHRDQVNAKVMKDPSMQEAPDINAMPFDMKRMAVGGFSVMVDV